MSKSVSLDEDHPRKNEVEESVKHQQTTPSNIRLTTHKSGYTANSTLCCSILVPPRKLMDANDTASMSRNDKER
jgi:hypothetical protein